MLKSIIKPPMFCYATTVQTIAAAATAIPGINISNDAAFLLLEIRASVYKVAAITGDILMSVQLGGGELFSNVGIDILSFASVSGAGNAASMTFPIKMPNVLIPANSELNVSLTNNNAESVDVQIQFWGIKVPANQSV